MMEQIDSSGMEQPGAEVAKLIFSCSGAADAGEIADRAARQLDAEGDGTMSCIAGIGGEVDRFIEAAKAASTILVIDGCEQDCARLTLKRAGVVEKVRHIRITDLDKKEGNEKVSVSVGKVVEKAREKLAS